MVAERGGKVQWWLIGLLTTALTIGGSAWLTSIRGEVIALGAKHDVLQGQVTTTATRLLAQEEALREIRIDVREIRRLMELGRRP